MVSLAETLATMSPDFVQIASRFSVISVFALYGENGIMRSVRISTCLGGESQTDPGRLLIMRMLRLVYPTKRS